MTPRRLPLDPEILRTRPQALLVPRPPVHAGWTRKTLALAMHVACFGLFGWTVVMPVVSPAATLEIARELKPLTSGIAREFRPLTHGIARELRPLQRAWDAWLDELSGAR